MKQGEELHFLNNSPRWISGHLWTWFAITAACSPRILLPCSPAALRDGSHEHGYSTLVSKSYCLSESLASRVSSRSPSFAARLCSSHKL